MENTIENKGKFISMYWGQYVCHTVIGGGLCKPEQVSEYWGDKDTCLELKPLSAITDEDAYGTGILINCWNKAERKMSFFKDDEMRGVHISGGKMFAQAIGKEFGHGLSHPFANNSTDN